METTPPPLKSRHGCLAAYLIFMIVANTIVTLTGLFLAPAMRQNFPNAPALAFVIIPVLGLANVICAIALWRWRRWGFFGFAVITLAAFVNNLLIGLPLLHLVNGFLGVAILYGVLHIGKDNKGWTQLE